MLQREAAHVQIALPENIHLQMAQVIVMLVGPEVIKAQPVKQLVTLVGLEHIHMREQQVVQVVQIGTLNAMDVLKVAALLVIADIKYQVRVAYRM